jgi:hypothetical protein
VNFAINKTVNPCGCREKTPLEKRKEEKKKREVTPSKKN